MRISDWSSDVCSSDLIRSASLRLASFFHFNPNAPVDVELDRLLQWGKTLGVAMLIEFDREIFISDFGRDLTKPSTKGNGRKILSALIGLADHHGIVVETSYMTEEMKLGAYYRSFGFRSEEHTSELQSLMTLSYAVICLKKKQQKL